jgi:hypothetical protein
MHHSGRVIASGEKSNGAVIEVTAARVGQVTITGIGELMRLSPAGLIVELL